jgi:hypothetical protein
MNLALVTNASSHLCTIPFIFLDSTRACSKLHLPNNLPSAKARQAPGRVGVFAVIVAKLLSQPVRSALGIVVRTLFGSSMMVIEGES